MKHPNGHRQCDYETEGRVAGFLGPHDVGRTIVCDYGDESGFLMILGITHKRGFVVVYTSRSPITYAMDDIVHLAEENAA
ncbi:MULTISPECIES: hypothetical protein [Nocardia]|uniref:hypothetical protein n=1 Tax=Nocardia TaxID=1817 RepID=UPI001300AB49|nr:MULTISPECIES: hypothetical protein [Nocardia]